MSHLRNILGLQQGSCGSSPATSTGCPIIRSGSCGGRAIISGNLTPIGSMTMFAGTISMLPPGWLVCNGTAFSKSIYPALFGVIGFTYGYQADITNPYDTTKWSPKLPDMTQFSITFTPSGELLWIIRAE